MQPFRLRIPDDRKQIAADSIHHRLDHTEDRVSGNGRIDRAPTLTKDIECRLRGEGLTGRHHPLPRGSPRTASQSLDLRSDPGHPHCPPNLQPKPAPIVAVNNSAWPSSQLSPYG
jgi:hypothetical protein